MTQKQLQEQLELIANTRETITDLVIQQNQLCDLYQEDEVLHEIHESIGGMVQELHYSLTKIIQSLKKMNY